MYEYTSDVFAVGLEGFAPVDNDKISRMAAEGWEPTHMTTVHNGFAAVVLFRRERTGAPVAATRVRKTAARQTAAKVAGGAKVAGTGAAKGAKRARR